MGGDIPRWRCADRGYGGWSPDKALIRQSGRFPEGRRYSPGGAALTGATGDGRPDKALARNPGEGAGSGEVLLGLRFFAAVQRQ